MKKRIIALMAAMAVAVLFIGCGNNNGGGANTSPGATDSALPTADATPVPEDIIDTSAPEGGAISITDMKGREIQLEQPVSKAVVLTPADCEIIYALGAGDVVVGRGQYCDFPNQVQDIESVQSGEEANAEQIIALQPEAVFMNTMAHSDDFVKQLEDAGIIVIVSEASDIDGVYATIDMIGMALGKSQEATDLNDALREMFADIAAKAPEQTEKKTIYFETSPLEYDLWTAGSGTFMDEIATLIGLENIFGDVEGWPQIDQEQVIERNPDYIVTITMYTGEGTEPVDEILSRKGWEEITAIKEKAVFLADADQLSRPGPRLVDGANQLYNFIYGE